MQNRALTAITDDEKKICQNVVVFGAGYLKQHLRWPPDAIAAFFERDAIVSEIETLKRQYEDRSGIQERTQFFAQLNVNAMVPSAVNVLARALRGEYEDSKGVRHKPPTQQQYEAAKEVMNRANIQGKTWGGNDSVPAIDARSVQIAIGTDAKTNGLESIEREGILDILNKAVRSKKGPRPVVRDIEAHVTKD